jgi:uncharacterized protein YdaU (DUF1376 family)
MMHYYPFHIGDFRSATAHLSNEEELAYRRLLDWYYDTEKEIPLETQWVARRLRVGCDALEVVLNDFFLRTETGWKHTRCEQEIEEYRKTAAKNRENGKKGGRPKSLPHKEENPVGSQSVPSGNPVATHSEGNQEPRTKNQEPTKTRRKASPAECELFARFYAEYPRKEAKANAVKAWAKLTHDERVSACEAVTRYAAAMSGKETQYIAMPATWINAKRWQDETLSASAPRSSLFAGVI